MRVCVGACARLEIGLGKGSRYLDFRVVEDEPAPVYRNACTIELRGRACNEEARPVAQHLGELHCEGFGEVREVFHVP